MTEQIRVEDSRLLFDIGARTETLRNATPFVVSWKTPTAADVVPILTTDEREFEIVLVHGYRSGGTSVQIQIYYGTNTASGTEMTDGAYTFSSTSLTSMDSTTDFVLSGIPANNACWLVVGTVSGSVNLLSLTVWVREREV